LTLTTRGCSFGGSKQIERIDNTTKRKPTTN
jgi:hypothetical protein